MDGLGCFVHTGWAESGRATEFLHDLRDHAQIKPPPGDMYRRLARLRIRYYK
jgi:hypothetical protein